MKPKYSNALVVATLLVSGCDKPDTDPSVIRAGQNHPAEDLMTRPHSEVSEVRTTDGVTIHFDQRGQGETTVVLIHGWGCDSSYWQHQRDWLAERYRVVSVDLAGHGKSSANRSDWSMTAFAGDVAAVVSLLDLDNIVLVGHSMGGPVALEAARLLEDRVIGVVGADTLWNVGAEVSAELRQGYMDKMQQDFSGLVVGIVENMFLEDANPAIRDFVIKDMASTPSAVGIPSLVALNDYDDEGGLEQLPVPLVLINSDYRPNNIAAVAQRVEGFQFVEMTGVGHFVMLEDPDTFNEHLEAAIRKFAKQ